MIYKNRGDNMFVHILSWIHNITTMLFGIYISAFFLGVKQNKNNITKLALFSCLEGIFYLTAMFILGEHTANSMYPFLIHVPLFIYLFFYYKFPMLSCMISICSAYLCCQISNWCGLFIMNITKYEWAYYFTRITVTIITFIILCRYVCSTTSAVFAKRKRELCIIGFLPLIYYIFDYAFTKFSNLLYTGNRVIVEFMGFAFCIAYLVFLIIYFKEFEEKQEFRQYSDLMELHLQSLQNEIDHVKNSERTLSILRHDMRHNLNIILTFLQNNNVEKAIDYIKGISDSYDDTVVKEYCSNDIINSVISMYDMRFRSKGFNLICDISCNDVVVSERDFSTLLSNALENAFHALQSGKDGEKWAKLTIANKGDSVLLCIENPASNNPKFVDGIPVSDKKGHGIGVKSIIYYVERLNGQWHFSMSGNIFVLRVII